MTGKPKAIGNTGLLVLPPDKGRKSANLVGIFHKGGGWYEVRCFGGAKKCKAGECKHVQNFGMRGPSGKVRPIKAVARA